jgi:hypothetical protein
MLQISELEKAINQFDPKFELSFDELLEKLNTQFQITDEELFEMSEESILLQNYIDTCGY